MSKEADVNQLATGIGQAATAERAAENGPKKNAAAVALGKLGGKIGGPARARKLTGERRAEIAKKAAQAKWSGRNAK